MDSMLINQSENDFSIISYISENGFYLYIVTKCEKVWSRYKWFMYLKRGWNLKLHTISGFIDASSLHSVSVEHDDVWKLNKKLFNSFQRYRAFKKYLQQIVWLKFVSFFYIIW